jgi:hypothetical protein
VSREKSREHSTGESKKNFSEKKEMPIPEMIEIV